MPKPTIATATADDLAQAQYLLKQRHVAKRCEFCGASFTPVRSWQTCCSAQCRNAKHNEAKVLTFQQLEEKIVVLERQAKALEQENGELMAELSQLRAAAG